MAKKKENNNQNDPKMTKEQIKKIAAKVAADHAEGPAPQLLIKYDPNKKVDLSKIPVPEHVAGHKGVVVATLKAVRWVYCPRCESIEREVRLIDIKMDFDPHADYTMKDVSDYVEEKRRKLKIREKWQYSEEDAFRNALAGLNNNLKDIEDDIIERECPPTHVLKRIRSTHNDIQKLLRWMQVVDSVRRDSDGDNTIIPDLSRWSIKERKWVRDPDEEEELCDVENCSFREL